MPNVPLPKPTVLHQDANHRLDWFTAVLTSGALQILTPQQQVVPGQTLALIGQDVTGLRLWDVRGSQPARIVTTWAAHNLENNAYLRDHAADVLAHVVSSLTNIADCENFLK